MTKVYFTRSVLFAKRWKIQRVQVWTDWNICCSLGRACWVGHGIRNWIWALQKRSILPLCHYHTSSASKFSKVSESGYKTRQRPKGSEGLPASLRRGPGGSLRNVNSVPAGLVHPPHTVGLVPVHVGLGGGISMTLVMLETRSPYLGDKAKAKYFQKEWIWIATHLSWSFEPGGVSVHFVPCVRGVPTLLTANPLET